MGKYVTKSLLVEVLEEIGQEATRPGTIYLIGGTASLWRGWRDSTRDIDMAMAPEPGGIFSALTAIKRRLGVDIELVDPNGFVPALPGWQGRSEYICRQRCVDVYLYDFYSQALAKIDRNHERDRADVDAMFADGAVDGPELKRLCAMIDKSVYEKFTNVHWPTLLASVDEVVARHARP